MKDNDYEEDDPKAPNSALARALANTTKKLVSFHFYFYFFVIFSFGYVFCCIT